MLQRFDSGSEKSELPIDITSPISLFVPTLFNRRLESEIEAQRQRRRWSAGAHEQIYVCRAGNPLSIPACLLLSRGKRASEPSGSRWSPTPMDIHYPRGVGLIAEGTFPH
ncbi:hypothetical protein EVAR_48866_1 [Eumeta japonica]|uniref:Uncharacterized protein n=1 Tax=Eumeta variegata TaxID=151549 RepID=A0A4C1Y3V5_EUMVA|nr:hypothetical protein EVAR_48866_1 [Eumeta japonica]